MLVLLGPRRVELADVFLASKGGTGCLGAGEAVAGK